MAKAIQAGIADQFTRVKVKARPRLDGLLGFSIAGELGGRQFAIVSTTIDSVAQVWNDIFGTDVDRSRIQRVVIYSYPDKKGSSPRRRRPGSGGKG